MEQRDSWIEFPVRFLTLPQTLGERDTLNLYGTADMTSAQVYKLINILVYQKNANNLNLHES